MLCMVVGHSYLGGGCLVSPPEVSLSCSLLGECIVCLLKTFITNSRQTCSYPEASDYMISLDTNINLRAYEIASSLSESGYTSAICLSSNDQLRWHPVPLSSASG